ncbi:hypothetical protein ACFCZ1_15380 [Streptomyces sp. NPDC056224]|uniref:hypothetical protein n=1 Tax=Streptomyces sp. NPDC056224 TaxID=3345750 RepID=UPI0035DA9783
MIVRTTGEARSLGLRHPRVWRLNAGRPLLSAEGLTAEEAHSRYADQQPIPDGYRKVLAELGYPSVIPAGERLRELVATRGWKSHGAVVDAVTVATLVHGGGIGLHQAPPSDAGLDLVVTRAAGGERIVPAFSTKSRPIPAGDLVYGLARPGEPLEPLAWLGKRDCDAAGHQLAPDSHEALLVVLGCPGEDARHSEEIGATVARILTEARFEVVMAPVPLEPAP